MLAPVQRQDMREIVADIWFAVAAERVDADDPAWERALNSADLYRWLAAHV